MGGRGSGSFFQWWRREKKAVVEHCLSIDANLWMREGILRAGVRLAGTKGLISGRAQFCTVGYEVDLRDLSRPFLWLWHSWGMQLAERPASPADVRPVPLSTTRPRFGGLRWWFHCPLLGPGGRPCHRRVGKLYLPRHGRFLGCRQYHNLTYKSCQEHDKRVDALRRNPALLDAIVNNPGAALDSRLILVLKALDPRKLDL
jgi:hypothetical protein